MKSWAVAGSTPWRRVRREYECMRASSRRAHPLGGGRRRACTRPCKREARRARGMRARPRHASAGSVVAAASAVDGGDAGDLEVPAQHRRGRLLVALDGAASARVALGRRTTARRHRTRESRHGPRDASSSNSGTPVVARQREHQRREEVVEVVGASWARASISPCTCSIASGSSAPIEARSTARPRRRCDRVRAPVLELLVVEERIRPGGEDLVREHRRLGGVDAVHLRRRPPPSARGARAGRRRRVLRAACRRPSGGRARGRGSRSARSRCSWHAAACGNTAAMRSSASMRWIGGGFLRPPRNRSTSSARLRFQRQRGLEHGRVEDGVLERVLDRGAVDVAGHLVEHESCGAVRARARSRRRWPPPAARS